MIERIDLTSLTPTPDILRIVPADVACEELVLPVRKEGDGLVVAVENPYDDAAIDRLRFILNREIFAVGFPLSELKFAIWRFYWRRLRS